MVMANNELLASFPLLKGLRRGRYRWFIPIPRESASFYGNGVELVITSLHLGLKKEPPLSRAELTLASEILSRLPKLLRRCEREFHRCHGDPERIQNIANPHIWISRKYQTQADRREEWAFVVSQKGGGDYATHLDFKRFRFLGCWSGS
jgi:hypothetical protein